jgi:class 3 adenylate cyclase
MRFTTSWPAFVPRVIAEALASAGDHAEAAVWFERAIEDAREAGSAPELERCEARYATITGREVPQPAGVDATVRNDPQPAVDALSVEPATVAPRRSAVTRTVLVTDLVGSTALNERMGDVAYLTQLREHDRIIRLRLREFDGVEFKHTGDGIGAWFFSANAALQCACALARDFEKAEPPPEIASMQVRIALSAGEPELVGTDLLGIAVTVAFRMLAIAGPGEVWVTTEAAGLCRGHPWSFERRGKHRLKGLTEPVELLCVATASDDA